MNGEVISEFLVKIGADVDNGSFNSCISAIKQLEGMLKPLRVRRLSLLSAELWWV